MKKFASFITGVVVASPVANLNAVVINSTYIGPTGGNWNLAANWSPVGVPNNGANTFNVFVDSTAANKMVALNANATVDSLTVDAGDQLSFSNNIDMAVGAIANNGVISLNSAGLSTELAIGAVVTNLTGTGTLALGPNINNRITGVAFNSDLVNAAGHTIRGSGQIGLNVIDLINNGLIQADQPAAALQFDLRNGLIDNFNNGTMEALNGATMTIINSNLDNTLGLISAQAGSFVDLSGSSILGGELTTDGTGLFRITGASTLSALINTGAISVLDNVDPVFSGTITNQGLIEMNSTANLTDLLIGTNPTMFTGAGEMVMGGHINNRISGTLFDITLVNDDDHTIRGSGQIGLNVIELINDGLIQADNPVAALQFDLRNGTADNFNNSTMESINGATMVFVSTNLDNSLGLIRAGDASFVDLNGSTIVGGELTSDGTGLFRITGASTLSALINTGAISVLDNVDPVFSGTITNQGLIEMNSTANLTDLLIGTNPTMFTGAGEMVMGGHINNRISGTLFDITLVNDDDHTIRGSGQIGLNVIELINDGLIQADNPVAALQFDLRNGTADNFNNSTMESINGATMTIVSSALDNSLGLIRAGDASFVDLNGSTIVGGELTSDGTGLFRITGASTLADLTNTGRINVPNDIDPVFSGTITNENLIRLDSTGLATDLKIGSNPTTFAGAGELVMSDNVGNRITGVNFNSVLVNAAGHTIRGSGQIGIEVIDIVNQGSIIADSAAGMSTDQRNFFNNEGTIHVTGDGSLLIGADPFTNSGTVTIDVTRTLTRIGAYVQTAGSTTVNGTLSLSSGGAFNLGGGSLRGSGLVTAPGGVNNTAGSVEPGASVGLLLITGNYSQGNGDFLQVELGGSVAGTEYDRLVVTGNVNLGGVLNVSLINGFTPAPGQKFTFLIHTGTRVGSFCSIQPKGTWDVVYTPNSVQLVSLGTGCPHDVNGDSVVNVADLLAVVGAWGTCPNTCPTCHGDVAPILGNGVVNVQDLLAVVGAWGACP